MKTRFILPILAAAFFGCSSPEENKTTGIAPEARAQYACMSGYTVSCAPGTASYTATFSWNTCTASYSPSTASRIEVQPLTMCGPTSGTGPLAIQTYALPSIFSPCTGNYTITVNQVGEKCMYWRLVNWGINNQGENCQTASQWQYFKFVP